MLAAKSLLSTLCSASYWLLLPFLAGCAAVDGAVPGRVYNLNTGQETFRNQSTLLNIVRASFEQPLNFFGIAKITDQGSVTGNLGLPTFNFGTTLTQAQKVLSVGPNSASTQVSTSFDYGVLETTEFYTGMMTPVNPITINLLLHQGLPRSLVFLTLIESVRVYDITRGEIHEYKNDPFLDQSEDCPDFDYYQSNDVLCQTEDGAALNSFCQSRYSPAYQDNTKYESCSYHKFEFYMQMGLKYGLSAETRSRPNPDYKPGGSATKMLGEGHICFDPALSQRNRKEWAAARESDNSICDGRWRRGDAKDTGKSRIFPFDYQLPGKRKNSVKVQVEFVPRSTFGVFQFLGRLLKSNRQNIIRVYNFDYARSEPDTGPLLNITQNQTTSCFTAIEYGGQYYCVPAANSENTRRVFSILTQLTALNIKPGDLPITPTVQLSH